MVVCTGVNSQYLCVARLHCCCLAHFPLVGSTGRMSGQLAAPLDAEQRPPHPEHDARIFVSRAKIVQGEEKWAQKDPRLATLERTCGHRELRVITSATGHRWFRSSADPVEINHHHTSNLVLSRTFMC